MKAIADEPKVPEVEAGAEAKEFGVKDGVEARREA